MDSRNKDEVCPPQLLDLMIPSDKNRDQWVVNNRENQERSSSSRHGGSSLELRLAPPGDDWSSMKPGNNNNNINKSRGGAGGGRDESLFSLGCFSSSMAAEKKKTFSQPASANTAVSNTSQKRTAPAPVVGWPPIRSFRKNIASSSASKPASESQNVVVPIKVPSEKPAESCIRKGLFVKINMDGVPIGRKVDLKAYDSYEKLSSAVDELFRGLLAAQRDSSAGGIKNKEEEEKPITGVLDGSGEYTLVYEDNEGDRMLVGDVPWHMFVSTVKRLRVLKSSEVSALSFGNKQHKIALNST